MTLRRAAPWIIGAAVLLAFANGFAGTFVFDDRPSIVDNPRIRRLWGPGDWLHRHRPLTYASLAANYALDGLNPRFYHLFNLLVHAAAALLLYGILRKSAERLRVPSPAAAALAAALLWAVHPLQTESVTYIVQRGESLMGLFYLLALYAAVRAHESSGPPRAAWGFAAAASCWLGAGCKPGIATAPLAVMLYDRAFLFPSFAEALKARRALYAALLSSWLPLGWLLAAAPPDPSAGFGFPNADPVRYALAQPGVILHYVRIALWPDRLTIDYGWPLPSGLLPVLGPAAALAAALALAVRSFRISPAALFLTGWFFLTLAPTSSLIPLADPAFEHRMYLPLAALAAAAAFGGAAAFRRFRAPAWVPAAAAAWAVLALSLVSIQRNRVYQSELALWTDSVAGRPQNPRARFNLGKALYEQADFDRAAAEFAEAIRLNPGYAQAYSGLAFVQSRRGNFQQAIDLYRRAIELEPGLTEARNNLALLYLEIGMVEPALASLEEALRREPGFAEAHNNKGMALIRLGRNSEAIASFSEAARLKPEMPEAHKNLGNALIQEGRVHEGVYHLREAIRLKPDYAAAQRALDAAESAQNNPPAP